MEIDAKTVMKLRGETDAGMMDCKKALADAGGNYDKAKQLLAERGLKKSEKLGDRVATAGWIGSYVHTNGKIASIIEVNCNTDFTARNEQFQDLIKELAVAVAAFAPAAVSKEQMPKELVEGEKQKFEAEIKGKPPQIAEKIVEGKLEKNLYSKVPGGCLLHMPFPKEDKFKGTYGELVKQLSAKTGENIVVRRFVRMELGS